MADKQILKEQIEHLRHYLWIENQKIQHAERQKSLIVGKIAQCHRALYQEEKKSG